MPLIIGENTYGTLSDAETYFGARLGGAAWRGASAAQQAQALTMAFHALERLRYVGQPTRATQPAQWPRTGILARTGVPYPADAMPGFLVAAQCEEALAQLQRAADPGAETRASLQGQGVTAVTVGDASEQYAITALPGGLLSRRAFAWVEAYLLRAPSRVWSGL